MEREHLYFDPELADKSRLNRPVLTNRIDGRPAWVDVYPEWWAGATIASPNIKGALVADKMLRRIRLLLGAIESGDKEATSLLNEEYCRQTDVCRSALLRVLQTEDADVILETNGTSAISLVRNMIDIGNGEEILTTNEEGNVVFPTLQGRDPWIYPSMFEENVGLFTSHKPVDHQEKTSSLCVVKILEGNNDWKTNVQILREIEENLQNRQIRLVMIPQVTKTGRILPVREIGELIKNINERKQRQITYVVDGVQALGRLDAKSICRPLEYCDYYIGTSSKALGGILIAAAIVAKPETLRENLPKLLNSAYAHHLRHYQFSEGYPELDYFLAQQGEQQAISLPEICSFSYVLDEFYNRGMGKTFAERRNSQLDKIQKIRRKIMEGLSNIRGVQIYDGSYDAPIAPSIITFTHSDKSAKDIKTAMQDPQLGPMVTLSANVGRLMRIEIPEHRPTPDVSVLIEKMQKVIENEI